MEKGVIHVLPEDIVGKIAAGEVVERPASVVKELIENAIDANARKIEIEIKEGGQKLIEVTDDGVGMCSQDAVLAFTPHATSKIRTEEDLDRIASLGFRGEALATIAAVSRITMVTRQQTAEVGTMVQIDGGRIGGVEQTHYPRGTRIQIKNLFFNVPARRKFLKSAQTEMAQISDVVCNYMMGYPELVFRFTKNNIPIATSTGSGQLLDGILSVYGPEVAKHLVPLKEPPSLAGSGMSVRGFISPPNEARPSARYMTTLVNRRAVRTKLISQAIAKAISAFFPKGKYPVLVLDLRMPAGLVDVNVHPQKTEVRFRDERWIFGTVMETIQSSLSGLSMVGTSSPGPTPFAGGPMAEGPIQGSFDPDAASAGQAGRSGDDDGRENQGDPEDGSVPPMFPEFSSGPAFHRPGGEKIYELKDTERLGPHSLPVSALEPVRSLTDPKVLAQFQNAYLLGEDQEGLFILDQHAAHERILFDTYRAAYRDSRVTAQPLLFPIPLKLLPSERLLMKEKRSSLQDLGFAIQQEDDGQYYATAVPILGNKAAAGGAIQEILSEILGAWETRTLEEIKIDLLKTMACKAAVKAGDPLKDSEMRALLEQLLKTQNPFTCPHGRPVALRLSRRLVEHSFLRT